MRKPITKQGQPEETWDDPLVAEIRPVVREAIEKVLKEELGQALGASWYARNEDRVGYRNGAMTRELGTPMGRVTVDVPRARLIEEDGRETEWRSTKLRRHARRMRGIDLAVLSIYLSGTNQRRVKVARVLSAGVRSPRRSRAALGFRTFGGCSAGGRAPRAVVIPADQDGGAASVARRSRASVKFHGIQAAGSRSTASACRWSATR